MINDNKFTVSIHILMCKMCPIVGTFVLFTFSETHFTSVGWLEYLLYLCTSYNNFVIILHRYLPCSQLQFHLFYTHKINTQKNIQVLQCSTRIILFLKKQKTILGKLFPGPLQQLPFPKFSQKILKPILFQIRQLHKRANGSIEGKFLIPNILDY